MSDSSFTRLLDLAIDRWYEPEGLLFAVIAETIALPVLLLNYGVELVTVLPLLALFYFVTLILWHLSRRPPKPKKGKIGFLVCFDCDQDFESKKLKEDFVKPLRRLLGRSAVGRKFEVIEINQRIAKDIQNVEEARELRARCNAAFALWGNVKLRVIDNENRHLIELNGMVGHAALPEETAVQLKKEFSELLPNKIEFSEKDEFGGFTFSSNVCGLVAHYVIGYAAAVSGDLPFSRLMIEAAEHQLSTTNDTSPLHQKLQQRIPKRLAELDRALIYGSLEKWRESKSALDLARFFKLVDEFNPARDQYVPDIGGIRAIAVFLENRDTAKAKALIKNAKLIRDGVYYLNLAFLYAYEGNLTETYKLYRKAAGLGV